MGFNSAFKGLMIQPTPQTPCTMQWSLPANPTPLSMQSNTVET